jgi:hypothetical protein
MTFLSEALSLPGVQLPLQGPWHVATSGTFPERATVAGWPFRKARWLQKYPGVVAQYREECTHNSMHLKVIEEPDGSLWWVVDHEDGFNPDRGKPLQHFFHDYEPGRILKPAAFAMVGALVTRGLTPSPG